MLFDHPINTVVTIQGVIGEAFILFVTDCEINLIDK